jgi:hypothetical protein
MLQHYYIIYQAISKISKGLRRLLYKGRGRMLPNVNHNVNYYEKKEISHKLILKKAGTWPVSKKL